MILIDTVLDNRTLTEIWKREVARNVTKKKYLDWIEDQEVMIVVPVHVAKHMLMHGIRSTVKPAPLEDVYSKLIRKLRKLTKGSNLCRSLEKHGSEK